jgi:hypothetical protein
MSEHVSEKVPQISAITPSGVRRELFLGDHSPSAIEQKLLLVLPVIGTPLDTKLNSISLPVEQLTADFFSTLSKEGLQALSAVLSPLVVSPKYTQDHHARTKIIDDAVEEIVNLVNLDTNLRSVQ